MEGGTQSSRSGGRRNDDVQSGCGPGLGLSCVQRTSSHCIRPHVSVFAARPCQFSRFGGDKFVSAMRVSGSENTANEANPSILLSTLLLPRHEPGGVRGGAASARNHGHRHHERLAQLAARQVG